MKRPSKIGKVMHEFKTGTLHSGKGGPVVKSRKQAVAIAMSEAGMSKTEKTHLKKHERSEGKAERKREYGSTTRGSVRRSKRKSAIEGK